LPPALDRLARALDVVDQEAEVVHADEIPAARASRFCRLVVRESEVEGPVAQVDARFMPNGR
jgi:hypothetical protein